MVLKNQILSQLFVYSFNIAIKSNRYVAPNNLTQNGIDSCMGALMEEAKSMLEVGSYHENIVNLQGVTCMIENGIIHQVSNTYYAVFISYKININFEFTNIH